MKKMTVQELRKVKKKKNVFQKEGPGKTLRQKKQKERSASYTQQLIQGK